uniref:RNA-directed DNA polymerase, eukaryota n=1 Tax=Tanacetum cinerariifolium TaxID=118510 RepID=A0A6L2MLW5_TANCI|nr:RNA-directed DNA polymerase, eukaryota [Tanacetum cinerariifolium]
MASFVQPSKVKMDTGPVKKSFVLVMKSNDHTGSSLSDSSLAIVMDDSCIVDKDLSCSLMGKIKDINALLNIYVIFADEGFDSVNISYLGGFWILIEACSVTSKEKMLNHKGLASWFFELCSVDPSFVSEDRLVWISIEGLPFNTWNNNAYAKIISQWGTLSEVDTNPDSSSSAKKICVVTKVHTIINQRINIIVKEDGEINSQKVDDFDHVSKSSCMKECNEQEAPKTGMISEDPFGIYSILKRNYQKEKSNDDEKFDPSFPLNSLRNVLMKLLMKRRISFKLKPGGSILDVMEDLIKIGHAMGYNMEGCSKNIEAIVDRQGVTLGLRPSVGLSSGILCVWNPNVFSKESVTVSDSFVAVCGTWISSSLKLMFISVYAPQDISERRSLWDYINHMINSWDGECIILGDFNEVRSENERFGSSFNEIGAKSFNHFISSSCLIDLPLEGYSFNRALKSASKMSKLDRFLISEGLISIFPSLVAICLDRHLSDHMSILLRESTIDYGPIPFCVFHSWFTKDGFDNLSRDEMHKASAARHSTQSRISELDKLIDKGLSNNDIINERISLLKDIHDLDKQHSSDLAQKAKIQWAIEGQTINLDLHMFQKISIDQNADLESDVSLEEIKKAVWECGTNKSSRPDGFSFDFIRKYWKIIQHDVVNGIKEFFSSSKFPPGSNSSFITLIPKSMDAKMVKDFRPISLIDGPFILNELISWCKYHKTKAMIFKADFEKAFNLACLSLSMGSILVNGSPSLEFKFHKGLKQGDPLSHFLFILVMESLHISFNNILNSGFYKGIRIDESLTLSYLFYADDAVFIGKWDKANVITIVNMLKCFYLASGLKINIQKSKIIGIRTSQEEVDVATNVIGCNTFSSPFNYLGVKVVSFNFRSNFWDEVIAKLSFRLSKWKIKTLSIGGHFTLNKVVLSSLPIYLMSIYKTLVGVLRKMESIRRRFFNGADINENKMSMMGWEKIMASRKKGGLGISSFFAQNSALLFKCIWRFRSKDSTLWYRVIKAMYGDCGALDNTGTFVRSLPGLLLLVNAEICIAKIAIKSLRWRKKSTLALFHVLLEDNLVEVLKKSNSLNSSKMLTLSLSRSLMIDGFGPSIPRLCRKVLLTSFFSCSMARNITTKLARWWEFYCPDLFSYDDWLEWFHTLRFPKGFKDILEGVFNVMEIHAFSQNENESLTDAWLRIKEMLQNCHAGGIFLYKTPNQDIQLLEDKVLLKLDWAKNQKTKSPLKKTVDFTDEALKHLFKKQDAKPRLIRWILLLQEFDIEKKDIIGTENVTTDHLSRIENDESSDDSEVDDNFPGETLMEINTENELWFADVANYLVANIIPKGMTYQQKNKFFSDHKHYFWEEPYLFKVCFDRMIRRCVSGSETRTILDQCHHGPAGPFPKSHKFEHILIVVDYVSKWVEAQALPTNDARVVVTFLKKLLCRFGMPKALINDRGDFVMLKVSSWKGMLQFKKKGKLSPRFIGPFKILKKCLADESSLITLDDIEIDMELTTQEEPVAIQGRKS